MFVPLVPHKNFNQFIKSSNLIYNINVKNTKKHKILIKILIKNSHFTISIFKSKMYNYKQFGIFLHRFSLSTLILKFSKNYCSLITSVNHNFI